MVPDPSNPPVALVTGASRGIGAAAARALARAGASVALVARSRDKLDAVAKDVEAAGGRALVLPADLSDPPQADRVVQETLQALGRLDALVLNAGVIEPIGRIADVDLEAFERAVRVNHVSCVAAAKAALPSLRAARGRLIVTSTGAATRPIVAWGAYCTSKAAVDMLTRIVASEEPDVTCVNFSPGTVDTEMQADIRRDAEAMDPGQAERFQELHARGELRDPEWVGRALAWLALRAPGEMSGETVRPEDERIPVSARGEETT